MQEKQRKTELPKWRSRSGHWILGKHTFKKSAETGVQHHLSVQYFPHNYYY